MQRTNGIKTAICAGFIGASCLSLGALLPGCSLGQNTLSMGYNSPTGSVRRPDMSGSLGGSPKSSRTRTAMLNSRSPSRQPRATAPDARQISLNAQKMINAYRKTRGLRPLVLSPLLTQAARAHAQDLSKWDRISHYGSDGANPWERVRRTGYKARLAAENVGTGQTTLEEVFRGWQKSPSHDKNLLMPDATQMGIALVHAPKTEFKTFWVLVVGRPL